MPHFTITLENRDELRSALQSATDFVLHLTDSESDWVTIGCQLADYLEEVQDYAGDGNQLILNTAPVAKFAPLPAKFKSHDAAYFLRAMNNTRQGLEQFIALCPHCGWGEFLNAVRATLDNARAAV